MANQPNPNRRRLAPDSRISVAVDTDPINRGLYKSVISDFFSHFQIVKDVNENVNSPSNRIKFDTDKVFDTLIPQTIDDLTSIVSGDEGGDKIGWIPVIKVVYGLDLSNNKIIFYYVPGFLVDSGSDDTYGFIPYDCDVAEGPYSDLGYAKNVYCINKTDGSLTSVAVDVADKYVQLYRKNIAIYPHDTAKWRRFFHAANGAADVIGMLVPVDEIMDIKGKVNSVEPIYVTSLGMTIVKDGANGNYKHVVGISTDAPNIALPDRTYIDDYASLCPPGGPDNFTVKMIQVSGLGTKAAINYEGMKLENIIEAVATVPPSKIEFKASFADRPRAVE